MLALRGGSRVRDRAFPTWPVWGEEEEALLLRALHSGRWGIGGELVEELASKFAEYQGCKFGVACANGTVALKMALRAVGIKPGDEVITTPYTFIATASAIVELGASPVFADIQAETLNIDPSIIEERITDRTKAILPVHIAGYPANMDEICTLARKYGLKVIEDAAQAHGSEWKGRRVGGIGDAGCFSFQSSKVITSGEGGIITTNDEGLASTCWSLSNCGRTKTSDWYQHSLLGYNYRMTEFQAAVLLAQLTRLDSQIETRRRNFAELCSMCRELEGFEVIPPPRGATRINHSLIPIRIKRGFFGKVEKQRVIEALRAEGIPCSAGYTLPLYRYRPIRQLLKATLSEEDYPNVERACSDVFWLPHFVLLGGYDEVLDIYEALRKLEKHRGDL